MHELQAFDFVGFPRANLAQYGGPRHTGRAAGIGLTRDIEALDKLHSGRYGEKDLRFAPESIGMRPVAVLRPSAFPHVMEIDAKE